MEARELSKRQKLIWRLKVRKDEDPPAGALRLRVARALVVIGAKRYNSEHIRATSDDRIPAKTSRHRQRWRHRTSCRQLGNCKVEFPQSSQTRRWGRSIWSSCGRSPGLIPHVVENRDQLPVSLRRQFHTVLVNTLRARRNSKVVLRAWFCTDSSPAGPFREHSGQRRSELIDQQHGLDSNLGCRAESPNCSDCRGAIQNPSHAD